MFKHIALIHSEFLKLARRWEDMSIDEQRKYVFQHPKSKKQFIIPPHLVQQGKLIARQLHMTYNGYWPEAGKHTFTDPVTHSSILAKDVEQAKFELEKVRNNYKRVQEKREQVFSQAAAIRREFNKIAFSY